MIGFAEGHELRCVGFCKHLQRCSSWIQQYTLPETTLNPFQVTTPDDISVAEGFLKERGSPIDVAAIA